MNRLCNASKVLLRSDQRATQRRPVMPVLPGRPSHVFLVFSPCHAIHPQQLPASSSMPDAAASIHIHKPSRRMQKTVTSHCHWRPTSCGVPTGNMDSSSRSARRAPGLAVLALSVLLFSTTTTVESTGVFTIINHCKTTIWPAATPGDSFGGGGFELRPGQSAVFKSPAGGWSGRIWGRTGCVFDASGNGSCATGSCGTTLKCGTSGATPVSLAEFTTAADRDFYDVSLVDGFNLPVTVRPVNARGGNCSAAGCDGDLRETCPTELAVKVGGRTVACRSACDVFDTDQYCCRGRFGSQPTCPPTPYSKKFKDACPTAYSYAYDDASSLFTCSNPDYIITFCASRKQQACSYHNNKLVCSDATSSRSWPITSKILLLLLLPLVFSAMQFPV